MVRSQGWESGKDGPSEGPPYAESGEQMQG